MRVISQLVSSAYFSSSMHRTTVCGGLIWFRADISRAVRTTRLVRPGNGIK